MKILRAIGAFFAKIGRWIANTAWIQPLLIVGGIFGVIFSIPYIKTAIENSQVDNTDYDYKYYTSHSLDLSENGRARKLFTYLAENKQEDIDREFGKKFFVSFIKKDCASCKEGVEGWKYFDSNFKKLTESDRNNFKLYTIVVDKKDPNDDEKYLAENLWLPEVGYEFFFNIACTYGEDKDSYALYKHNDSVKSEYTSQLVDLPKAPSKLDDGGLNTPLTFMYDSAKVVSDNTYCNVSGITAVFYNYVSLITEGETNKVTKAQILADCWNYKGDFNPDLDAND